MSEQENPLANVSSLDARRPHLHFTIYDEEIAIPKYVLEQVAEGQLNPECICYWDEISRVVLREWLKTQ